MILLIETSSIRVVFHVDSEGIGGGFGHNLKKVVTIAEIEVARQCL